MRNEKQSLEQELALSQDKWLTERQKLVEQKDSERRKALDEIQEQNEQDYRDFLTEHQDTLNKALKTAREQFTREKVHHNIATWHGVVSPANHLHLPQNFSPISGVVMY